MEYETVKISLPTAKVLSHFFNLFLFIVLHLFRYNNIDKFDLLLYVLAPFVCPF
jgi:hypothetical protein